MQSESQHFRWNGGFSALLMAWKKRPTLGIGRFEGQTCIGVPAQIAAFLLLTFLFDTKRKVTHALRCSTASLSAIMAMNSPFGIL